MLFDSDLTTPTLSALALKERGVKLVPKYVQGQHGEAVYDDAVFAGLPEAKFIPMHPAFAHEDEGWGL